MKKKQRRSLHEKLIRLHHRLRNRIRKRWDRSLPFAEQITDRWERADFLGFGKGSSIYDSAIVLGRVTVGEQTWIGPFTILDGSGGLEIGSHCSISAGVQIYSHDSVQWAVSGGRAAYDYARTRIGSRCFIGPNTVIAKGVTIGDGCIIGANSLVLKEVPPGTKAFGTPCRPVDRLPPGAEPPGTGQPPVLPPKFWSSF